MTRRVSATAASRPAPAEGVGTPYPRRPSRKASNRREGGKALKREPVCGPDAVAPSGPGVLVGFILPFHTVNELNGSHRHWRTVAKRRKSARLQTASIARAWSATPPSPPLTVLMTRHSAGTLDDDGLRAALKSVRDGIADWLGVDDKHTDRVSYGYAQEPCKRGFSWVTVEVRKGVE
jgi:hypothetical protein